MANQRERGWRRVLPYVRSSAIGCALALVYGVCAAQKAAMGRGQTATASEYFTYLALTIPIAIIAGVLYQFLAPLRRHGRALYVLSWMLALAPALAIVMLPEILFRGGGWLGLAFALSGGAGAGLGFGLFAYAIFKED